jgi:hypothetical protein
MGFLKSQTYRTGRPRTADQPQASHLHALPIKSHLLYQLEISDSYYYLSSLAHIIATASCFVDIQVSVVNHI